MNVTKQASPLLLSLLPEAFAPVSEARVEMDGRPVIHSRAERSDGAHCGLGGEHVSIVESEDGTLLGFAPHDETITVNNRERKQTLTLTGMKVKMRSTKPDQLWFWVIVGPNEEVMVFERDIFWVTMPGHRRTEKWLHDSWLAEKQQNLSPGEH